MAVPLTVGDNVVFDGATGTVVTTTATTDAYGEGSITYGGETYSFKAVRAEGPDVPIVATADDWFRVGLLRHATEPTKLALVLDDPHEGRLIRARSTGTGDDGWLTDLEDHEQVFVTCWEATGRVLVGGVAEASVYVGLEVSCSTTQGGHLAWPLSPWPNRSDGTVSNTVRGSYATDANGYVKHVLPDGTAERLLFPRGHGAWGQRSTDLMWKGTGQPTPERTLTEARLVYGATPSPPGPGDNLAIPGWVELTEGGATLDCRAAQLTINGPNSAGYRAQLEGSGVYRAGALSGAGTVTLTEMLPGTWHVRIGPAYSTTYSWPARQTVVVPKGGSPSVNFGASSALPAPPNHLVVGFLYRYGAEAYDGTLNITYQCPGQSDVTEQHAVSGSFSLPFRKQIGGWWFTAKLVWCYDGEGYWGQNVTTYTTTGIFFNMAVGGKVALHSKLWGPWGDHLHALPLQLSAHVSHTGDSGSVFTELVLHGDCGVYLSEDPTHSHKGPTTAGNYTIYGEDGSVLGNGTSGNDPLPSSAGGDDFGIVQSVTLGGRIHGDVVAATEGKIEDDPPLLEDAARLGGERGTLAWGMEFRHYSEALAARGSGNRAGRSLGFAGMECPYCGGEVWRLPDLGGYTRGYCTQCAYEGRGSCEARTFLASVTLPSFADWRNWASRVTTGGETEQVHLHSHWRPEDYREVDGYLSDKTWLGPGSYTRWVAKHWTFGTWADDEFTDGTDIAAQEALLPATLALRKAAGHCPATIGPCQLKAIPTAAWTGAPAHFRATCTRPDSSSETVDFTIPTGFGASGDTLPDFVRLSDTELTESDQAFGPTAGFYTDVTALVCLDSPPPSGLEFTIVNDSPHRNNALGAPVTEGAAEPYLVLWGVFIAEKQPDMCRDHAGIVHRVYVRGSGLAYDRLESRPFGFEARVTGLASGENADMPTITRLQDGTLLIGYRKNPSGVTGRLRSTNYGKNWTAL